MISDGSVDLATREVVSGWAWDRTSPQARVSLLITVNDVLVARVLADRPRDDLKSAGIGDGCHSFEVELRGLPPGGRCGISVRRETDGAHLNRSPVLLEPVTKFDREFRAYCAGLMAEAASEAELDERLGFLAEQAEALLRLRARNRSSLAARAALRQIKWRWAGPGPAPQAMRPRALVIDESVPDPSRDAGSNAVLSHMRALVRIGFDVDFGSADMAPDAAGLLEAEGITCCHAPWHGSVEEILRREADSFDVIYLHRASIAMRYLNLARFHQPRARVIYSVADLHHLRLGRQARVEQRPDLLDLARKYQAIEMRAASTAHAVLTHSSVEANLLRAHIKGVEVHVVLWSVASRPTPVPLASRRGVAFIGHYGHSPNRDAALWLRDAVMPQVHAVQPGLPCLLVGSDMPEALRRPAPGIELVGRVADLGEVFDRVRLTVAPMTYGAGIKGKVLESMAAGVPCVCTPVAAEGLDLPPVLRSIIAQDAPGLAAIIVRLHEDAAFNQACREAGLAYVAEHLSEQRLDAALREAVAPATALRTSHGRIGPD